MHKYYIGQFENEYGETYVVLEDKENNHYLLGDETSWEIISLNTDLDTPKEWLGMTPVYEEQFSLNKDELAMLKDVLEKNN